MSYLPLLIYTTAQLLTGLSLDDFEVVIFLTETSSRHAILKKEKMAKSEKSRLGTTERHLTGSGTKEIPAEVEDEADTRIVREDSQENVEIPFAEIPIANDRHAGDETRRSENDQEEALFLSDSDHPGNGETIVRGLRKRSIIKEESVQIGPADADYDDKKKMALNTTYDGFSIYGKILCLVVKRRGIARGKELSGGAGQAMMEDWISSTQAAEGQLMDD